MNRPGMRGVACVKMPDGAIKEQSNEATDNDSNHKKRQQLLTFAHNQWGFKNWNWSVTKQELDFIDYSNGKYNAGVVAFVSVSVHSLGLHREDIGYATTVASQKGSAIYNARKASVTNALKETLLSFGGKIAVQLSEYLEQFKVENEPKTNLEMPIENLDKANNSIAQITPSSHRKDSSDSSISTENHSKGIKSPQRYNNQHTKSHINHVRPQQLAEPTIFPPPKSNTGYNNNNNNNSKIVPPQQVPPPSAMVPGNVRPNSSNVSYLVQHVMPPLYSVQCGNPHTPSPPVYHNAFFTEIPPWPLYDANYKNKVNFNVPPKNFVMSSRPQPTPSGPHNQENDPNSYLPSYHHMNGAWIKPTIFYDGFWTEQKVQKWVAEQMEKPPVIEESRTATDAQKQMCHSKV